MPALLRFRRYLLAATVFFGLTSVSQAADVKIENYSNNLVYVAQADNKGRLVSHGWTVIKPNESKTFSAPDSADLYIRVQDKSGKAITFTKHKKFLNFPAHNDRFTVNTEPDDSKVWVLKHGASLQNSTNIKKGDKLPPGWSSRQFFEIGTGSHKLEIKP